MPNYKALKICIADLWFRPLEFYKPALAYLEEYELVDWQGASTVADCDVLLLSDEFWPDTAAALPLYHRHGIPSLHLIDGILEWRNLFENPRSTVEAGGMPLFQPLLSTQVACLGSWQRDLLGFLGSTHSIVITGSPRFDPLLKHNWRLPSVTGTGKFTIMVSVAKTPGFTSWQQEKVIIALRDIHACAAQLGVINERDIEVRWRITDELATELGWNSTWGPKSSGPLGEELNDCDAVISTPSTLILESMLSKRPVAMIDYTAVPRLVLTAWTISSMEQIGHVIASMAHPPFERMAYQDFLLQQQLDHNQLSGPRVAQLIRDLAELGRSARLEGKPLQEIEQRHLGFGETDQYNKHYPLSTWHPHYGIFHQDSLEQLQAEVMILRRKMLMEKEASDRRIANLIAQKSSVVASRNTRISFRRLLAKGLQFLSQRIDKN